MELRVVAEIKNISIYRDRVPFFSRSDLHFTVVWARKTRWASIRLNLERTQYLALGFHLPLGPAGMSGALLRKISASAVETAAQGSKLLIGEREAV